MLTAKDITDMVLNEVAVSVIIPVYNTGEYLHECLESLHRQNLSIEIILIDDGSTDNSKDIVDYYHEIDNRVKVITQQNRGPRISPQSRTKISQRGICRFFG